MGAGEPPSDESPDDVWGDRYRVLGHITDGSSPS